LGLCVSIEKFKAPVKGEAAINVPLQPFGEMDLMV
jgi:hypothetical protein